MTALLRIALHILNQRAYAKAARREESFGI